jgi:hypothetical protein
VRLPLADGAAATAPPEGGRAPDSGSREPWRPRARHGSAAPAKPHGGLVDAILRGRDAVLDRPDASTVDADPAAGAAGR